MKTLVTGSTGKVGAAVVEALATAGQYVRAASRSPENVAAKDGVEVVRFDYGNPATFAEALKDVDRIFLMEPQPAVGPADEVMLPLLEAALQRECKVVLLSSASVSLQQEPLSLVEEAAQKAARWVIVRANWFMDNFHTWWAEPIKYNGILPLPAGDALTPFIDARDVGAAAAAALMREDVNGKIFQLTGPEALRYDDAAAVLGQAIQREVRYVPMEDEEFAKTLSQAGLPEEYVAYILSLFRVTRTGRLSQPTDDLERLTGKTPRSLREYAADYREMWQ
jgi:uncharacterized protein YbjT (DUF2867 family)